MKKLVKTLLLGLIVTFAYPVAAQVKYDKGDKLFNVGLGFGNYFAGGVPITGSFEFFINDAISIGPYVGFTSYKYNYPGDDYKYTFFDFGARGSYHFSKHLNLNTDKLDLYGAVLIGYTVSNYKNGNPDYDPYGSAARAGVVGGARWYFSKSFSVNGEVGYGLAPLLLGISLKF
jgi:hypothetical protein